jgi:hypothetical protein
MILLTSTGQKKPTGILSAALRNSPDPYNAPMSTFGSRVISFCKEVDYQGSLPAGIAVMNPFRTNPDIIRVITQFYNKFYGDNRPRHLILGINPGRFGGGVTGIPFTDTKRLREKCGLSIPGLETFETSSSFVYDMIENYGGTEKFYSEFYINSVSPLGFVSKGKGGKEINYNYYDSRALKYAIWDFAVENIKKQMEFGINSDICFCLGTGKNYKCLLEINSGHKLFDRIVPLEHPRYIMQYRSKQKQLYIEKYVTELKRT